MKHNYFLLIEFIKASSKSLVELGFSDGFRFGRGFYPEKKRGFFKSEEEFPNKNVTKIPTSLVWRGFFKN